MVTPPLIGLVGYAGVGKDTVGSILVEDHGYQRVAFADALKDIARAIGWNGQKDAAGRGLLQALGMACREHLYSGVWIDRAFRDVDFDKPTVITDVRLHNEIAAVELKGGAIIEVTREGVGPANMHVTEYEWGKVEPDATIDNNGDMDELRESVAFVLEGLSA